MTTRLLSTADVEEIVLHTGADRFMDDLIARMAAAFETFDGRTTEVPVRSGFSYATPGPGLIEWMPLLAVGSEMVLKVVGYHAENPSLRGAPTVLATLASYDTSSGRLKALVDGTLLTALRTGAASAVASRLLARPESRTLGLIGCGAQAVTQAHALSRVFEIERLLIYDIDAAAVRSLGDRLSGLMPSTLRIEPLAPETVAAESDILCVATSVRPWEGPVVQPGPTRPWLHVNAVGSDFPGKIELPLELLESSYVCPDFLAQARHEGECQQLEPELIGDDILRLARRQDDLGALRDGRTIFDSTGWALEDQVVLDLALERAERYAIGSQLEIESVGSDPRNPYAFLRARDRALATG